MVTSRAIALSSRSKRVSKSSKLRLKLQGAAVALGLVFTAAGAVSFIAPAALAQNAVSGAISGVVTDGSGAAVPGAQVLVKIGRAHV